MKTIASAALWIGLLGLVGCRPDASPDADRITQISVINALMIGQYDGVMSIAELLQHGDFGIGTLDHLDGEMVVLEGKVFQVRGDGIVRQVGPERSTPFAVVTRFTGRGAFEARVVASLSELDTLLDEKVPAKNQFAAIRIEGRFASIRLRSVHRQEPPYRPLSEVAKEQSVWTHEGVTGTLVAIRSPTWTSGLNVPGYHWHFLSDDRKIGGHVLDCRMTSGRVEYQECRDWLVKLSGTVEFNRSDLTKDLSRDLRQVEGARKSDPASP